MIIAENKDSNKKHNTHQTKFVEDFMISLSKQSVKLKLKSLFKFDRSRFNYYACREIT